MGVVGGHPTVDAGQPQPRHQAGADDPQVRPRDGPPLPGRHPAGLRHPGQRRLVFAGSRVAVFIDGCFWHGCPAHSATPRTNTEYWTAKIAANRARDTRADILLGTAGWTVVRVWEHEDPRQGAARIRDVVQAESRRRMTMREPGGEVLDGLGAQLHPRSRSLQRACPGVETGSS